MVNNIWQHGKSAIPTSAAPSAIQRYSQRDAVWETVHQLQLVGERYLSDMGNTADGRILPDLLQGQSVNVRRRL